MNEHHLSEAAVSPENRHIPEVVHRARQHGAGDLLRRTALRYPDKTAVIAGDVRATYAEFNAAVNRVCSALTARGIDKGARLALLSHNCWQFALVSFASAKLGVLLVPVNFMLGAEEVGFILAHSGATALIVEDELAPVAEQALTGLTQPMVLRGWISLHGIPAAGGWENVDAWTASGSDAEPDVLVADDDPIRLMYTSGTESRPKGTVLTSKSLIAQYVSAIVDGGMTADDIEVHCLPLYHCAQLDCFLGPDVYLGATSVILPSPEPTELLRTIQAERVTKLFAPPTVWISLLRCPAFDSADLSSLRKGYYGASAMPVEVLYEIQRRLPEVRLWNFYGQTEMAPVATILAPQDQLDRAGSAGRPVLNVETRLVDEEDHPVPPGVIGEIVHRSPQAALGYWNDETKTTEAFRGGWFHTGDLGVLTADGYLSVVDRKKDMIKTGGENVSSREVEEVVYQLDTVAEVAVFGVTHPRWIEAVVAAVVPRPGAEISKNTILAHCRTHLAAYKCPKYIIFVDALPKNPSGKILKRDLRTAHSTLAQHNGT